MSYVSAENVSVVYRNPRTNSATLACHELDFNVEEGEFVSIVGPSGCGKTTFLKSINGLISVTKGSIKIKGRQVTGPTENAAMVFQAASLLPWRSVKANVVYGLELVGAPAQVRESRASHYINLVGLKGFEKYLPHELSGGMQQRVNLARALAMESGLLLLDEPFAALDAQTREFMQYELLKIWARARSTAIFVTHDIGESVYLADKVAVFTSRPGRIREVITVPFSRPRQPSIKRSPEFLRLVDHIWKFIEQEAGKQGLMLVPDRPGGGETGASAALG